MDKEESQQLAAEEYKQIEAPSLTSNFKITIVDQTGQSIKLGLVICEQINEL